MRFDTRLFIYLSSAFAIFVVIGTLSHEFGHYLVAESFGYNASISFGSTHIQDYDKVPPLHKFWITLGGPMQTMLTGSIGLFWILRYHKSFSVKQRLTLGNWAIIFMALFWLRQLSNFAFGMIRFLKKGEFPQKNDESRLSSFLGLPGETLLIISAACAAIVVWVVVFRFVPKSQRPTFIASGIVGGFSGMYLWLHCLGKIIMP